MNKLVYYPTFEPSDVIWLKYALLYIEDFSPIIPIERMDGVSDLFKKLRNETDLIKPLDVTFQQGMNASTQTLNELDKVLSHPERYRDIFNHVNVVRAFKDESKWDFTLYEEKFNEIFRYYCIDNKIGKDVSGGIAMSSELANFYMANLADRIAFEKAASPITDLPQLDNMTSFLRVKDSSNEDLLSAARATIQVSIPKDIGKISFDDLIHFRNDEGIRVLRQALTTSLDKFLTQLEDREFSSTPFIDSLGKSNAELAQEVGLFFGGLTAATIGAIILIKDQDPETLEVIKQSVEGGIFLITGGYAMKRAWEVDKNRRDARKYLSRIGSL